MIEDFTYRNADRIIVISEDFKRNIMAKGVPESKIEVIYNWVDETAIIPIPRNENPLLPNLDWIKTSFMLYMQGIWVVLRILIFYLRLQTYYTIILIYNFWFLGQRNKLSHTSQRPNTCNSPI